MRNIDLASLEIFRTVVAEGGISRAAKKIHRVPSNVTTRIQQLEARLDTTLFERRSKNFTPTAEGAVLLGYANRLLQLADEAEAAVRMGKPVGTFRLGSLESTAGSRLPPILSRYNRSYPSVQIELTTGTTGALISKVAAYEIEAAFISEPFTCPELETLPVFEEELVLISSRNTPAIKSAGDVGRRTLIAFANGCSYRRRLEDWLGRSGVLPERVLEFASYQAIIACVAAGTGLAIVPRSVLHALRAAREIQTHPLPARIAHSKTHLIWPSGHHSLALDCFRTTLLAVKQN